MQWERIQGRSCYVNTAQDRSICDGSHARSNTVGPRFSDLGSDRLWKAPLGREGQQPTEVSFSRSSARVPRVNAPIPEFDRQSRNKVAICHLSHGVRYLTLWHVKFQNSKGNKKRIKGCFVIILKKITLFWMLFSLFPHLLCSTKAISTSSTIVSVYKLSQVGTGTLVFQYSAPKSITGESEFFPPSRFFGDRSIRT